MSLAERIAASSRRPTATVRVNGARWGDWLTLSRDQSYGGNISGGTATGRALPSGVAIGTPISWSWGYDGYETAGFSGVVSEIDTSSYPNRISLRVADSLWQASRRQKDLATDPLNSIAASTAITQFLSSAGLSRLSIPTLSASGSAWAGDEWIMGTLTPVAFANTTALAAAQRIAETLGYWLYADAAGVVRAVLLERRPSDSPFRTLRWGEDFVIAGPPSRRQPDTRKNRVVIRGANTGVQGAQIRDEWQDDPGDRSDERTFELIEYVNESEAGAASITGVARRLLRLLNRDPNIIEIPRLKADPRLSVGMTIAVVCARIGYTAPRPFFLYSLSTKLDRLKGDFAQSLTLDGGTGSGGYTLMPPPEASFAWRLVAETLDGTAVVEVFLDGSGSVALGGGEIVSYAWSTATAVASGYASTASGAQAMLVFPAATVSAEITLVVMDTSSKTGSITQTIPLVGDTTTPLITRTISLALGAAWAVTPDGGATWHVEATGDSTLVPELNGSALLSTRAAGSTGLRSSADALASASTPLAALGGQITALSVNETAPDRVWAAVDTDLYQSIDGGATFSLWGALPATIAAVLEDPAVLNSVFVLAGADMLHSTLDTPGTAWAVLYAGPAGAVARQLVRGQSGATTWIAYEGTFIGSLLQRVEGPISVTFPIVTPDVTEIRAIALSPDELSLYAWDAQGRGWSLGGQDGLNVTQHATGLAAGETAMHALHDPDDPIIYLPTFGEVAGTTYKYFPLADALMAFYVPADGQMAHRVGLGAPATAPYELLLLTQGSDPGGVWHYTGVWALKNAGLPVGVWWRLIATNPSNPSDWLLLGDNNGSAYDRSGGEVTSGGQPVLWRSTNSGESWAPLNLPDIGAISEDLYIGGVVAIGYTSTGQPYVLANWGVGETTSVVIWRGDAPAATVLLAVAARGVYGATAGQGGEIALTFRTATSNTRWGYLGAGASSITDMGDAGDLEVAHLIAAPAALGRAVVVAGELGDSSPTSAISIPDYRSGATAGGTTAGGGRVAGGWSSVYLGLRPDGVYRLTGLGGTPSGVVVAASGEAVGGIASDPQTRTVVAVLTGVGMSSLLITTDGETWVTVAGPGVNVAFSDLAVLTRPGL
jgi:hypothetical protein